MPSSYLLLQANRQVHTYNTCLIIVCICLYIHLLTRSNHLGLGFFPIFVSHPSFSSLEVLPVVGVVVLVFLYSVKLVFSLGSRCNLIRPYKHIRMGKCLVS